MNKKNIQHFFKTLLRTCYDPSLYRAAVHQPRGEVLRFAIPFALLYVAISLAGIFAVPFTLTPHNTIDAISAAYPSDLVFKVEGGHASINLPEPYVIPLTAKLPGLKENPPHNFVVFDTQTPFDANTFQEYSTLILVKRDFVVSNDQGNIKITPFKDVKNMTISRDILTGWVEKIRPWFVPAVVAMCIVVFVLGVLFGGLAVSVMFFAQTFLPALVVMIVSRFGEGRLQFEQAYKASLYAIVPVTLASDLMTLLHAGSLPYLASALAMVLIVLLSLQSSKREVKN